MRQINLEEEKRYENEKLTNHELRRNEKKYYQAVQEYIEKHNELTLNEIKGKKVLEIGCSAGENAKFYSKSASEFYGCDISDIGIEMAKSLNLRNSKFYCADAHKLPFKNNEFDIIIVNSLLHHLDLNKGLVEIKRVLKKNGALILREPLGINPIFNIYRKKTPLSRTIDERPFDLKDIYLLKKFFHFKNVRYFGLLSLTNAFVTNRSLKDFLCKVDEILSRTPLKIIFWQISGVFTPKDN